MSHEAGLFLIGIGVGMYLPPMPSKLGQLEPFLGLIVIIIGVLLMLRQKS